MTRRISPLTLLVAALVIGTIGSFAWSNLIESPKSVSAQLCGSPGPCAPDPTDTSSLLVSHVKVVGMNLVPVEPDDTDTWEITATWQGLHSTGNPACSCTRISASVTADVTWTGSAWSVSCTGCSAGSGPIRAVSVCPGDSCTSQSGTHSWQYELIVDIDDRKLVCIGNPLNGYLEKVEYKAIAADDGHTIDSSNCTEIASVSPLSTAPGVFASATDEGPFECPFTCQAANGPSTTIFYD